MRFWTKKAIYWKFWENFRKSRKYFFRKLRKCMILAYFHRHLTNHAFIFCAFGRKRQLLGNFYKIFENFRNFPSENCKQCIILTYFSNILTNYALTFCTLDKKHKFLGDFEKILKFFDENSIEKLNFLFFIFSKICF